MTSVADGQIAHMLTEEVNSARKNGDWFLALGIVQIVAGMLAVGLAFTATPASVATLGVLFLIAAGAQIAAAMLARDWSAFFLFLLLAVLDTVVGFLTLRQALLCPQGLDLVLAAGYPWRIIVSENRRGKPLLLLQEQETGLSKEKQVVEAEAQSRLRTSAYHALHLITCELHEDVLTLRGHVPTFHLKQVAQTLIRDLDGVGGIDNQLEVAESLPANLKRKASSSATGPQGQPIGDRTRSRSGKCFSVPTWHADFLSMLPTIRAHAAVAFGYLDSEAREDAIRDAINNAMHVYVRLVQLNKADLAYPTVLARYALARTKRRTRHLSTGAARARWRPRPPAGAPPLTLSRRTAGHLVSSGSQVVAAAHLTARSAEAGVSGTIPALEPRR